MSGQGPPPSAAPDADEAARLQRLLIGDLARAPADAAGWEDVLQTARRHGVQPLLYRQVLHKGVAPPEVERALQRAFVQVAARNAVLFREFGRLLAGLDAAGIPVILLKGAALARTVYADDALRPMTDIDVLVRHADVNRALACAQAAGYLPAHAETRTGDALAFENEVSVVKPGNPLVPVELHWSLLNSPHHQHKMPMDWFWDTAQRLDFAGSRATILGPEATLLHLCSHLWLHHRGEGLLWWNDIALALGHWGDRMDWAVVAAKTREYDLVISMQETLTELRRAWGVEIPAATFDSIMALQPSPREAAVHGRLTEADRPVGLRFADDLRGLPNWGSRARFAVANLFPSPDYMRRRYGLTRGWQVPLSYPYRWVIGAAGVLARLGGRRRP